MGYLLPIVAELLSKHDMESILLVNPDSDTDKLIRSVWFYCVIFQFVEREKWRSDWFECTRRIAHKVN